MSKTSKKLNMIVTFAALAVIVVSSMVTYLAVEFIEVDGSGGSDGYQNITFTDATLTCQSQTRDKYGKRIKTLAVDNHSSRYDERQFSYKIFFEMDLKGDNGKLKAHYVNCFVRSDSGKINKFEVFEVDGKTPSRVDDGTNMFGFPIK